MSIPTSWPGLALLATPGVLAGNLPDNFDGLRSAVVCAGDVDGDGHADLACAHRPRPYLLGDGPSAGAPLVQQQPLVWVLSGKDGAVIATVQGPGFDADAFALDRSQSTHASQHARGTFGSTLVNVGDLDGDGLAELALGSGSGFTGQGVVVLAPAKGGGILATLAGPEGQIGFGRCVAGGVDVVGDQTPDLAIAARDQVWVLDGSTRLPHGVILVTEAGAERQKVEGWALAERGAGAAKSAGAISQVHLLPDMDGDGLGEVLIGHEVDARALLDGTPGRAELLFSSPERERLVVDSEAWCALGGVDLDGDGAADFVTTSVNRSMRAWSSTSGAQIWGQDWTGGYMYAQGTSLTWAKDRDGDGAPELWCGINETFFDADPGNGFLVSGATGELRGHSNHGRAGLPPSGGMDVCALSDIDGDGIRELGIQHPLAQVVRVVSGADGEVLWSRPMEELELR